MDSYNHNLECVEYNIFDQPVEQSDITQGIFNELNKLFEDRLDDIDKKADGDFFLKYQTCMDWINVLRESIKDLIETVENLESEASKRIALLQNKLKHDNHSNEAELRHDLMQLIKFIQNAASTNKWDWNSLKLLSMNKNEYFGELMSRFSNSELFIAKTKASKQQNMCISQLEDTNLDESDRMISTENSLSNWDSQIDREIHNRVRFCEESEAFSIKHLKRELEEFFKVIQILLARNQSNFDYRKIKNQEKKIEDLINQMLTDLKKTLGKLSYIKMHLNSIICGQPVSNLNEDERISDSDSGYLSQEDMEQELIIVKAIKSIIKNLKKENCELNQHISILEDEIKGCKEKLRDITIKHNKVLTQIAKDLSDVCRKEVPVDQLLLSETFSNIGNQFTQSSNRIDELEREYDNLKKENEYMRTKNTVLEIETDTKNQTILELKKVIDDYKCSFQMYENEKNYEANECKNQRETIQHLRLTLESIKRDKDESLTSQNIEFQNQIDYLNDELKIRDRKIMKLLDENVDLKEILTNYEIEIESGKEKYKRKEEEFNDKERNYLQIIDDLKNEVESLSKHVVMTQNEFDEIEELAIPFEETCHKLETHNDLLQDNIERLQLENIKLKSEVKNKEIENQRLKCQISSLEQHLEQSDKNFNDLNCKYSGLVKCIQQQKSKCNCGAADSIPMDILKTSCVISKIPNELEYIFGIIDRKDEELKKLKQYADEEESRSRKYIHELKDQIDKLNYKLHLSEKRRSEELHLANEKLKNQQRDDEKRFKNINDQLTEIKNICKQKEETLINENRNLQKYLNERETDLQNEREKIVRLEEHLENIKRKYESANKEAAQLKTENSSLQQKITILEMTEKKLQTELLRTQAELDGVKSVLNKYKNTIEDLDQFRRNCYRLKESNCDLTRRYNELVGDYNKLEEEYRKVIDLKDQMLNELEATREWQKEQCEVDDILSAKINKLQEHIDSLIQDRKNLLKKVDELHQNMTIIEDQLECYKETFNDSISDARHRLMSLNLDSNSSNIDTLMQRIRRTAWKASQIRTLWDEAVAAESNQRHSD